MIDLPKFLFDTFSLNSSAHCPCQLIQYNTGMHFSNEGGVHKACAQSLTFTTK